MSDWEWHGYVSNIYDKTGVLDRCNHLNIRHASAILIRPCGLNACDSDGD